MEIIFFYIYKTQFCKQRWNHVYVQNLYSLQIIIYVYTILFLYSLKKFVYDPAIFLNKNRLGRRKIQITIELFQVYIIYLIFNIIRVRVILLLWSEKHKRVQQNRAIYSVFEESNINAIIRAKGSGFILDREK